MTHSAPQWKLSGSLAAQLSRIDDKNWDVEFFNIIKDLQGEHELLDPVLQTLLLKRVMEEGSRGSHSLATVLHFKRIALEEAEIDYSVNWLSPTDREASKARITAKEALDNVRKAPYAQKPEFARPVSLRCVARLGKDADGKWQCMWESADDESGELVVVRPAGTGTSAQIISVGKAIKGVVSWNSQGTFVEGRPLFLLRKTLAD